MQRFSSILETSLRRAGWYPGRLLSDESLKEVCRPLLREQGCRLFPSAVEILREFGGLQIAGKAEKDGSEEDQHAIKVWPSHCLIPPKWWFRLEWQFGEVLFPIAVCIDGEMEYFVASSGKIFGYGYGYWYCGATFDEALERLKGEGPRIERINITSLVEKGVDGESIYDEWLIE